ncbi:MAG: type III-B CRISPR module-associated protein Cmr5 [Gallionellaceae bacterium]
MINDNRTRTQRYAEKALAKIEAIEKTDLAKEYKSRSDSFSVMVLQAGLAQAVGFMLAKGAKAPAYSQYLDDLSSVMGAPDGKAFHHKIIHASIAEYRQLTRETLNAAGWFKRFGQAYLTDN